MPLTSDIQIDVKKFRDDAISPQTREFDDGLIEIMSREPRWYEIGVEKYRQMRWNGETALPRSIIVESAKNISLPSREPGRSIPCRVFQPESGRAKGAFYHIHGGGWVLQSEAYQDVMLQHIATHTGLSVLSVGYRLAPEHPYPAGNEDCFDVGAYLVDHGLEGAPLRFVGGDSAGAHLAALTCFHLLQARPDFALRGVVLNFGVYDVAGLLPHVHHFDLPLVLRLDIMKKYIEAYLPNTTEAQRRDPWISPLYADLKKMKTSRRIPFASAVAHSAQLPPALFTCGTLDPLLDDSILMSTKWTLSGAEGILKVYPGAPHGYVFYPIGKTETTKQGLDDIATFMNDRSG